MSGNTIGADFYSDGSFFAPMMPVFPQITICHDCDTIFWLNETNETGMWHWGEKTNPAWENAVYARFLSIEEYFSALEMNLANNKADEFYIRQQIWWGFNNAHRYKNESNTDASENILWTVNIHKLLGLLDSSNNNDLIMKAELHRNLGNFDTCLQVLDSIVNPEVEWLKNIMIKACKAKNRKVIQLKQNT
jgi:hypothetical protein